VVIVAFFLKLFLFLLALFLIVLILIQRGKGGGLAGAFGGMGGQSAFGTKAGDTFTRITIGVATVWILLCIVSVRLLGVGSSNDIFGPGSPTQESSGPLLPGDQTPGYPAPAAPTEDSGSH
jgi:preprotein translocase subunit SecG